MQDISIRPTSVKYGLYYAGAATVYSLITFSMDLVTNIPWSMLAYVISIGVIYLAIKEYKELNEGFLSLKQGIGIGVISMVVGGAIASALSFIYFSFINKDGIPQLLERLEEELTATEGMTPEIIEMTMGIYEKTFQPIPMFFMGILGAAFSGLIIGLILGAILKSERPMMDYEEIGN